MLRIFCLFLFSVALYAQSFIPQSDKLTPEYKSVIAKNKIESFVQTEYPVDSTFSIIGSVANEISYSFDKDGNLLKAITKTPEYNTPALDTIEKNAEFLNLITATPEYYTITIDSFAYDAAGKLKSIISYFVEDPYAFNEGNITIIINFDYDNNGKVIKAYHSQIENGKPRENGSFIYQYDKDGNLVKIADKTQIPIMEYFLPQTDCYFGANGKILKEVSEERIVQYKYDDKGKLIQMIDSVANIDPYTVDYEYDANGNQIASKGEGVESINFSKLSFNADNLLISIQDSYKYDDSESSFFSLTNFEYKLY